MGRRRLSYAYLHTQWVLMAACDVRACVAGVFTLVRCKLTSLPLLSKIGYRWWISLQWTYSGVVAGEAGELGGAG